MKLGLIAYSGFALMLLHLMGEPVDAASHHIMASIGATLCVGVGALISELLSVFRARHVAFESLAASYRLQCVVLGSFVAALAHVSAVVVF